MRLQTYIDEGRANYLTSTDKKAKKIVLLIIRQTFFLSLAYETFGAFHSQYMHTFLSTFHIFKSYFQTRNNNYSLPPPQKLDNSRLFFFYLSPRQRTMTMR